MPRPPTGYAGQDCLKILACRDKILKHLAPHPMHAVAVTMAGMLDIMMHIANIMAMGDITATHLHLYAQAAALCEILFSEFARLPFPANSSVKYANISATTKAVEMGVRQYDHWYMHHAFTQLTADADISLAESSSAWIEANNKNITDTLLNHTSLGGGHQTGSSGSDQLRQVVNSLCLQTHPLITVQIPQTKIYKCGICGEPKLKHNCTHQLQEQADQLTSWQEFLNLPLPVVGKPLRSAASRASAGSSKQASNSSSGPPKQQQQQQHTQSPPRQNAPSTSQHAHHINASPGREEAINRLRDIVLTLGEQASAVMPTPLEFTDLANICRQPAMEQVLT